MLHEGLRKFPTEHDRITQMIGTKTLTQVKRKLRWMEFVKKKKGLTDSDLANGVLHKIGIDPIEAMTN